MTQTATPRLKKGASVNYRARKTTGSGKIAAVRDTTRGPWYDVKKADGTFVSCRAGQLELLK
jgi:hypothetical protein